MKKIAIIPNNIKDIGLLVTKRVVDYLLGKAELYMENKFSVTGMKVNYVKKVLFLKMSI